MIANKSALKMFCEDFEKIENYEQALNDETQKWDCHHRLETHNSDGEKRSVTLSIEELKAFDMYFHRPPEEFIFIPHSEHISMHSKIRYSRQSIRPSDYVYTEEHRRHISESNKGKTRHWKNGHPMLGRHQSEKQRTSQSLIKRKAKWWTNGTIDKFCEICPNGFEAGRSAKVGNHNLKGGHGRPISNIMISVYEDNELVGTFPRNKIVEFLNELYSEMKATEKGWGKAYYKDKQNPVFYYKGLKFVKELNHVS